MDRLEHVRFAVWHDDYGGHLLDHRLLRVLCHSIVSIERRQLVATGGDAVRVHGSGVGVSRQRHHHLAAHTSDHTAVHSARHRSH